MKRLIVLLLTFCIISGTCIAMAQSETEMLFFDSFDDTEQTETLWTGVSGNVDVSTLASDNAGVNTAVFLENRQIQSVVAGDENWKDYTFNVDMCFFKTGTAGVFFRYQSDKKHYLLQYVSSNITLSKRDGSTTYERIGEKEFSFSPNQVVRFKIVTKGAQIDVYADGEKLFSVEDSASLSGKIGLRAYKAHVSFDNTAVYVGDNEPQYLPNKRDFIFCPVDVSNITKFYYVSPAGSDSNDGSLDAPFKTIGKARDVIKSFAIPQGGVMVYLRGGEYYLENGEYLYDGSAGAVGSPIVYSSYPGERAALTGALSFDEDCVTELPAEITKRLPCPDKVLAFDLKELGLSKIDELTADGNYYSLFYNNLELTLARWPDNGWLVTGNILERGSRPGFGETDGRGFSFSLLDNRCERWTDTENIWMYGAWSREWKYSKVKVASFDNDNDSVTTVQPSDYGAEQGMPYYYYNVLEELDTPGEWYIDSARGLIYVYPPDNAKIKELSLTTCKDTLLRIANTGNIVFRNIDIKNSRLDGVEISNSNNIILQGCRVTGVGQIGVTIKGRNCGFLNGEISNTGKSGLFISSAVNDRKTLSESKNFCINSLIFDCGKSDNSYLATLSGIGNVFTDNYVYGGGNGGILFGGNENIIAYNEVSDVCRLINDGGAIYATGRDFTQRGNRVMFNYIHDVNGSSKKNLAGPSGIYLDALMSGTKVYGNTIVRTTLPILMGGGRDNEIVNNFLVQSTENSTCAINADQRGVNASEYEDQGTIWDRVVESLHTSYDSMPCTSEVWSKKYPTLANIWDDEPRLPKYNKICDNFVYSNKNNKIDEEVTKNGTVSENIVIADTGGFAGYENDDYTLIDNSQYYAQSATLKNTSFNEIGLSHGNGGQNVGDFYLLYPCNEAIIRNKDSFLSWSSAKGADTYLIEVARDINFSDIVLEEVTDETFYEFPSMKSGARFYWRVTAYASSKSFGKSSKTSAVKSFYTMTDSALLEEQLTEAKELLNTVVNMSPLPLERATINEFRILIDNIESSSGKGNDKELMQTLSEAVEEFCKLYLSEAEPLYSFYDDFNWLDSGATPEYDEVRGSVTAEKTFLGEKALLLKDDSSALYPVLIKKTDSVTDMGKLSFRIMPMQKDGFIYVKLRQLTSTAYADPIVFAIQNGGITVNNRFVCSFNAYTWYKFDIEIDARNKLFSVSVNEKELITDMPYEGAEFINAIVFTGNTYTGKNYLDDISAEVYPKRLKPRYDINLSNAMCKFECIVLKNGKILNLGEGEVSGICYAASYAANGNLLKVIATPITVASGETIQSEVLSENCRILFWKEDCSPLSSPKEIFGLP